MFFSTDHQRAQCDIDSAQALDSSFRYLAKAQLSSMVAISLAAPVAGRMLVTSHISDPALSPAIFNKWYSDIHVRDMVNNNFSSVALRYANYTLNSHVASPTFTLASQYLALYNVPDINFIN